MPTKAKRKIIMPRGKTVRSKAAIRKAVKAVKAAMRAEAKK